MAKLPKLCTTVLCAILLHGNTMTQTAWPSFRKLQELTGEKNRNYLANAIRLLVECGILGVLQTQKGFKTLNLYYFPSVLNWKSLDGFTKRFKLNDSIAQYPNLPVRGIRKRKNRGTNVDTLTNQNNNYPNPVTSIGDILQKRTEKWPKQPAVAIPGDSLHSVVRTAYEGDIPIEQVRREPRIAEDSPANAGELQAHRGIPEDTTTIPVNTGKLRGSGPAANAAQIQPVRGIQSDTTETPLKNGEKTASVQNPTLLLGAPKDNEPNNKQSN